MATNTTNYNLKKPALTDFYDVADQNGNMDLIDAAMKGLEDGKVAKVEGKSLSTNDFTTDEKTKLAGIASGAQVNTVTSVAGKTGAVTLDKTNVGLGNVDNTADANKAVLSATKLATARTIQGKSFDGTANITLDNATTGAAGLMSAADKTLLGTHDAEISDIEGYIGYTESDIYGVEVDFVNRTFTRLAGAIGKSAGANFDSFLAFGGRKRCNLSDAGVVNAYYGDAGYVETGANGQVMVEQPKFYYKVVPLKLERIPDYSEVNTFTVTAGASASGDISITLNGQSVLISVVAGDDINTVAAKIRAGIYNGWVTSGTNAAVIFTSVTTGAKTTGTFGAAATGVTATVAKTIAGGVSIGYKMRKARYYISDYPKPGFKIHPAFVRNSKEIIKIYLPAYEASLYDVSATAYILDDSQVADFTVSTGDKIASIANAKPISGKTQNLTRANTRILASNRGAGWQQKDILCASATQMLLMVEYAAMNTQTAIGLGVVNKADDGTNNLAELTGATTNLGNASGMAAGTNGFISISYRGEENFWGNIWKWIDGLNVEIGGIHQAWYADNAFQDDIKTGTYKNAGFTLAKQNGYISAIGWSETCDFLFLTVETFGDSSLPVGDYFYQDHASSGWRVALLGGAWYGGLGAGGFYWRVVNSSANRTRDIGGGAVYVPTV